MDVYVDNSFVSVKSVLLYLITVSITNQMQQLEPNMPVKHYCRISFPIPRPALPGVVTE